MANGPFSLLWGLPVKKLEPVSTSPFEREMDQLAFGLYGLTGQQPKLVEQASK